MPAVCGHRGRWLGVAGLLLGLAGLLAPAGAAEPSLRALLAVERARPALPPAALADFLVQPVLREPTLSPDGRTIAYLREPAPGTVELWSQPVAGGAATRWLPRTEAQALAWTRDGRWLLLATPTQLFAQAMAGQAGAGLISALGGRPQQRWMAVDPTQPAAVLLIAQTPSSRTRWQLWRVDMRGQRQLLWEDALRLTGFSLAPDGRLAWLQRLEGQASVIHRVGAQDQAPGRLHEVLRCADLHRCSLLPRTTATGEALLRSDLPGSLRGLQKLADNGRLQPFYTDPRGEADLADLVLDPQDAQPLFATHDATAPLLSGLTPAMQRQAQTLRRALPGRALGVQVAQGPNERWLVGERGDTLPQPRWWTYAPDSGQLVPVLAEPPRALRDGAPAAARPEAALARRLPLHYRASDGWVVRGFLTVPPGVDLARAPLVALVHGGPWNHAATGHQRLAAWLAQLGYVVFEPNFRGSTGLGRDHVQAAQGDFGGTGRVLRDIDDGVRWLLAQGVGDARRVGVVGASFGGYAALSAVTFSPAMYRVAVASVPPPDFAWALQSIARSAEAEVVSDRMSFEAWLAKLALDPRDEARMARLRDASPLAQVARLQRPVLLIAGGEDRRVDLSGVIDYAARLKALGKDVTLLVDPQAGHRNDEPLGREAGFYLTAWQLHRHLGGAAPGTPDAALQAYLARTLKLGRLDEGVPAAVALKP